MPKRLRDQEPQQPQQAKKKLKTACDKVVIFCKLYESFVCIITKAEYQFLLHVTPQQEIHIKNKDVEFEWDAYFLKALTDEKEVHTFLNMYPSDMLSEFWADWFMCCTGFRYWCRDHQLPDPLESNFLNEEGDEIDRDEDMYFEYDYYAAKGNTSSSVNYGSTLFPEERRRLPGPLDIFWYHLGHTF